MNGFVVDASVAVTWYYREVRSETAAGLLRNGLELRAPSLMRVETANALCKRMARGDLTLPDVELALADLGSLGLIWTPDAELLVSATRVAAKFSHPVYDCLYLVLAQAEEAVLATIDRDLANVASRMEPPVAVWEDLLR